MHKRAFLLLALLLVFVAVAVALAAAPGPESTRPGDALVNSTFVGGTFLDRGNAIAVDGAGNAIVAGRTQSLQFPATDTLALAPARHGVDVFALSLGSGGAALNYLNWVNPNPDQPDDEDYGRAVVVDGDGNAYVAGWTQSPVFCDFLGNVPGYDPVYNGNGDGFLFKMTPAGEVAYCTYVGGDDLDLIQAVAVDGAGNVVVAGSTWSYDFPVPAGGYDDSHNGLRDTFVLTFDPANSAITSGTFVGGGVQEEITSIALDNAGNVYATGWTNSDDFPTPAGAFDPGFNGNFDAFVFKLDPGSVNLAYSTFLGGSGEDRGYAIDVDASGRVALTGLTRSAQFPTTPDAFDGSYDGDDAFVARLDSGGATLIYGSFLGGRDEDIGWGIVLDAGTLYLAGQTASDDFPASGDAYDATLDGPVDAFVARVSPQGILDYATYLGGSAEDIASGLALRDGGVVLTGRARSPDFPTTAGAYDTTHNGDYDVFITHLLLPAGEPAPRLFLPLIRHN